MPTAFVTGATGFVGINLVDELLARDWQVTCLARSGSNTHLLGKRDVAIVNGTITDADSLRTAMPARVDAVFHVAGDTNMWSRNNARQTATNVTGTRNMCDVALEKGARRFVHTSTIAAWGLIDGPIDETTPQRGGQSWINYQKSKYLGEQAVKQAVGRGLDAVIVNPGAIVGAQDSHTWARMFMMIAQDELPGVPPGAMSFGHVGEVVKAHVAAAEVGRTGENYLLAGTEATMRDFVAEIGKRLGKARLPPVVPLPLLRLVARFYALRAAITGAEPSVTPEIAAMAAKTNPCSSRKAQAELGYRTVPLADMVADCADWLIAQGYLERPN
ncbi:NAD-dependent epimerase/dehydratase family protein [Zavarzinia compransoris]|uniref:NAD-dependent epimerase/dehydratase family protein n=1 Tax=Zavarzinia marina TaxID=2911065 RepID=UPI001F25E6D6|nr:NAD-dependent epimerase/dehydratase family protein [Zavarzinia marina]MCF4165287.1 NAD-dependent epimerase/dehydratase family protein [Zavarzinia marina]